MIWQTSGTINFQLPKNSCWSGELVNKYAIIKKGENFSSKMIWDIGSNLIWSFDDLTILSIQQKN